MQVQQPPRRLSAIRASFGAMPQRLALCALVLASMALLALSRTDLAAVRIVSERLGDAAVPALWALQQPIAATSGIGRRIGELLAVHEENERLKRENRQLASWQAEAARLQVQNRSLREVLAMPLRDPQHHWATARIVADPASPFVHTRLIDAGAGSGIQPGMAVMTGDAMVGRITDVGQFSARVLLVTDFNSRIPVITESSGDQALLQGDNSPQPFLRFLPLNPRFMVGDRVMTSGRGGVLPEGLIIGEISEVDDHRISVTPSVDWEHLDYVSVLLHQPLPSPQPSGLNVPLPGLAPSAMHVPR